MYFYQQRKVFYQFHQYIVHTLPEGVFIRSGIQARVPVFVIN